jgi:hypothetical protein
MVMEDVIVLYWLLRFSDICQREKPLASPFPIWLLHQDPVVIYYNNAGI